ncbi:unnamed protein product [Symbiodinium sp. KB8]|nr:unnamed protein product [Symbiodinium sp. KB8]
MAVCGKCKVAPPHSGNKWCLGCLAWEVIEKELGAPWPSAAHRAVGEDLVLTCCRALHRIRLLGSVDPEAPAVTPQVEAAPAPGAPATTGAVRALRVGGKGVEVEEYSYYSTEQEFVKSDPNSVKEDANISDFIVIRILGRGQVVSGFFCTTLEVKAMNLASEGLEGEDVVGTGGGPAPAEPLARPVAEGEEYSWEDLESWAQLAPNPGDVLELLVEGAEFGDGTVAAVLVESITTESSGGLVVTGTSLGASTPAARDALSSAVNRRKEPIHLCPTGPTSCESTGIFAIHVGNIKWWRPELFMADYLTTTGKKALQIAVKSRTGDGRLELDVSGSRLGRAAVASALPPATDETAPREEGLHATLERLNDRLRAGFPTADGGMPLPGGTVDGGLSGGALVNSGSAARISGPTLAGLPRDSWKEKEGRRERRKRKKKGKKRKQSTSSSSDSNSSCSSDSREVLEAPIARRARKDPGSVLGMLLRRVQEEMDMVGATGATGASNTAVLDASRLTAYLQQIVKPRSGQGWTRDLRECLMLAVSLDFMRKGKLPEAMDFLAARFMAIEQSMTDGNWTTASQIEIATPEQFGAILPGVLLATRRHVSRVHKAQGEKGKGKATWVSYGERAPWKGGKKGDGKGDKGGGKTGGKRDGAEKGGDDRKREDGKKR